MGKYDALGVFLRAQNRDHVPMRFDEIERVVGIKLPKSQAYPAWWSNSTSNNVMTQIWLDAGYRTEQVDTAGRKLVFRRAAQPSPSPPRGGGSGGMSEDARKWDGPQAAADRHPAIGWLKGTFSIEPGYDVTRPALDPDELAEMEANIDRTFDMIEAGMKETS
ncbi:MAG TPA: hypothetical protein VG387_12700 [Rhizomicrobium sp.]|jgi:hypothetical protein|nr:hypothetical protein [Rhizomicrobium sp.]